MIEAKSALIPNLGTISGTITDPKAGIPSRSFDGVTDVIGGPNDPRGTLEKNFPGSLILEINGTPEPKNASALSNVTLSVGANVPCPAGTQAVH
jgi:hypothetical protein